jgi:hypothetical protein
MKSTRTIGRLLASLAISLITSSATAQTINWGSTVSTAGAGNMHNLSDGSAMSPGFTFQLGYFSAGFNAADPMTWAANWNVYNDSTSAAIEGQTSFNGLSGPFGYNFAKSTTNTLASFNGQQGYIWGFNDQGLTGLAGGEALLLTNSSWTFPSVGNNISVDWTVSTASNVVWGAIDTNGTTAGGYIAGGGVQSAPEAANTFHVQTSGFVAPVPEPSSALLVGLASLGLLRRRRSS